MADEGRDVELTSITGQSQHGSGDGHENCDGHAHGHAHGHDHAEATEAVMPKEADIFNLARSQNFQLVQKLLEAYPHYWTARDEDGHSLLHWAALVGSRTFVQTALERGLPVDIAANNKQTPLMWAVLRGHVPVARVLLDAKATVQIHDSLGATPLMIAIQHKQYACMLLLMHKGPKEAMLRDADKNGCASVHWAAYKGDITALKFLHYFGADMEALDNSKMLPLHRAVSGLQAQARGQDPDWRIHPGSAYHSVIEFLVDRGCDPTQKNADGKSCMDIVEQNEDVPMQTFLKKLVAKASKKTDGTKPELDLESGMGEDSVRNVLKDKTLHKIFPVFWLICVSMATFCYLMDQRDVGWKIAPWFSLQFELGVPLSIAVFAWAALTDPGIVPPKERGASGVEELMRLIDSTPLDEPVPDITRLCTTTWVLKGLRTKYCVQTGACVEEFDHYCVWLNCAIGKNNHRHFVLLACVEFWTQVCHLYLCWIVTREIPYTSFGGWLSMLLMAYPMLLLVLLAHCVTAPWVFMLLMHQARMIIMNVTTNELLNIQRYDHFWVVKQIVPGHVQRQFRNPFHKGGVVNNCLDFWWYQNRGYAAAMGTVPAGCGSGHCSHCH